MRYDPDELRSVSCERAKTRGRECQDASPWILCDVTQRVWLSWSIESHDYLADEVFQNMLILACDFVHLGSRALGNGHVSANIHAHRCYSRFNNSRCSRARVLTVLLDCGGEMSVAGRGCPRLQVAQFDNFYIRSILGKEAFYLPAGAINDTHLVRNAFPVPRKAVHCLSRRTRWLVMTSQCY